MKVYVWSESTGKGELEQYSVLGVFTTPGLAISHAQLYAEREEGIRFALRWTTWRRGELVADVVDNAHYYIEEFEVDS